MGEERLRICSDVAPAVLLGSVGLWSHPRAKVKAKSRDVSCPEALPSSDY